MFSTAVIGAFQTGLGDTGSEPEIEKLDGLTGGFWPMTVSYFEPNAENRSEEQPIYAVKFLVYQNGVSRDMTLVYPNFQLSGKLIDLKISKVSQLALIVIKPNAFTSLTIAAFSSISRS